MKDLCSNWDPWRSEYSERAYKHTDVNHSRNGELLVFRWSTLGPSWLLGTNKRRMAFATVCATIRGRPACHLAQFVIHFLHTIPAHVLLDFPQLIIHPFEQSLKSA